MKDYFLVEGMEQNFQITRLLLTKSKGEAASSNIRKASNFSKSPNQNVSQSQIQCQNSTPPWMNENEGINSIQNTQGRGSSHPTSTWQNDTPNSVPPFVAAEATLVENSVPSNVHFPEPSAPMRGTPVINAVIVDSSRNVIGNDDDNMSEKCSIEPDPTVSFWRRHRTLLIIGILLVIIGALVGSIVSIIVVGNNRAEPSEAMAIGSSPTESSSGSWGESTQSQTSGPSPFQAKLLNPTSPPTIRLPLSLLPSTVTPD